MLRAANRTLSVTLCVLLIALASCSKKDYKDISLEDIEVFPKVNVDSIFINLDADIISKKAANIDKVFSNLRKKTGFNGTVLYAEQGRIIYEKAWGFRNVRNRKAPGNRIQTHR